MPKGGEGGGVKCQMHTFCIVPTKLILNNHILLIMFIQVFVNLIFAKKGIVQSHRYHYNKLLHVESVILNHDVDCGVIFFNERLLSILGGFGGSEKNGHYFPFSSNVELYLRSLISPYAAL